MSHLCSFVLFLLAASSRAVSLPDSADAFSDDILRKATKEVKYFLFIHSVSASGIADSIAPVVWMRDAEASASSDASASCYRLAKNIGLFAVVEAERELVQIKRQVFLTDLMVAAHDAALEQAPESFNRVCVQDTRYIFASGLLAERPCRLCGRDPTLGDHSSPVSLWP